MTFHRYAIYYTPQSGQLAKLGASWLGWDVVGGQPVPAPNVENLPMTISDITASARRYGFHATIAPPFRLASAYDAEHLKSELVMVCKAAAPVTLAGLGVAKLGRFLALTACGDGADLNDLAASVIRSFDKFRATLTSDELNRRRKSSLSPRQHAMLLEWGYPYVMDEYRFHMTLTGKLPRAALITVQENLASYIAPALQSPLCIDGLSLMGEDQDGMFHQILYHPLCGRG